MEDAAYCSWAEQQWKANVYDSSDEKIYKSFLLRAIDRYRKEGSFTDIVIVIGDYTFEAHKLILSAASKVFNAMLTSDMKEKTQGRIDLSDTVINPCIFKELLDYMYTGKISISSENVEDFMSAANFLMLPSLSKICCDFLLSALAPDNCLGMRSMAERFNCGMLLKQAEQVLRNEFLSVLNAEEFLQLNPEELCEILQMDDLQVQGEEEVLNGLLRWMSHAPTLRRKHFSTLIYAIRLQYIHPKVLHDYAGVNEDVKSAYKSPKLVQFLRQAETAWHCRMKYNALLQVGKSLLPRNCLNRRKVMFACGGYDGGKCSHASFAISPDNLRVHYLAFMGISKHDHGVAVLNGVLYVIGGFNSFRGPLNVVEIYNPARNSWGMAPPMNNKRKSLGVSTLNNLIYASGGLDANYSSLRTVEVYDPSMKIWQYAAPMGEAKYAHSLVSDGRYLYAIGGWKSAEVERYDPITDSWAWLPPMHSPRAGAGAVIVGHSIYITGGYGDSSCTSSVEVFDVERKEWKHIASMSVPRWRSGIIACNDVIYVIGGRDSQWRYLDLIEKYEVDTEQWSANGKLPIQVMGLRCCLLEIPLEHLTQ